MRWKTVLFDLDGVLLKGGSTSSHIYENAVEDALNQNNVSTEEVTDQEMSTLIAPEDRNNFEEYREICDRLDIDAEDFWTQKEDRASELEIKYIKKGNRELRDGAVEVLENLDSGDVSMGVVSNNSDSVVKFVVDHFDLDHYLSTVHGLDNTIEGFQNKKPEPHYINNALREMGINPDEGFRVAYVGDKHTDILAAKEAGIEPVYVGGTEIDGYSQVDLSNIPHLE